MVKDFRNRMEQRDQSVFLSQLIGVWIVFLVFWLLGSLIFMKTEEWGYGTAIYFAFCTFTTIGYGDLSPASPAGRAIFTVWALMGVATMTVLISVVSEAYSTRYKTAVHNHAFDQAVASFKEQNLPLQRSRRTERSEQEAAPAASMSQTDLLKELSSIPADLVRHARVFHDHVLFLHAPTPHKPPTSIRRLLNDIAKSEKLDERVKVEVLEDDESRKVLFDLSYERALHELIASAEKIVDLLGDVEQLVRRDGESDAADEIREAGVNLAAHIDDVALHDDGLEGASIRSTISTSP